MEQGKSVKNQHPKDGDDAGNRPDNLQFFSVFFGKHGKCLNLLYYRLIMLDFQPQSYWRRFIHSKIFLMPMAILMVILLNAVFGLYNKSRVANQALELVRSEETRLKEREAYLTASIAELETERGVEKVIREKFGMVRPGERVINLVEPKEATATPLTLPQKSFWQRWLSD